MLKDEIIPYLFHGHMVCDFKVSPEQVNPAIPQNDPTGNGHKYTGIYFRTLQKRGEFDSMLDEQKWGITVLNSEIEAGLVKRSPVKPDQQSIDDYCALALDSFAASRILEYGRSNPCKLFGFIPIRFVYNTEKPGTWAWGAWFGRWPQLIAHFMFGTKNPSRYPWLWRRMWMWATLKLAMYKKPEDGDAWMLTWCVCQNIPEQGYKYLNAAKNKWLQKVNEVFGDKAQEICKNNLKDKDHPLGKYFVL